MKQTIKTYDAMSKLANAFVLHMDLLLVTSGPGLGKSTQFRAAVADGSQVINGKTSAFKLYQTLYHLRDRPVVIDDVDHLLRDRDAVCLLKELCQTEKVKTVTWNTSNAQFKKLGIPPAFETMTRLAILANQATASTADVLAVQDRGLVVEFRPTAAEVHAWVATWRTPEAVSDAVYEFIGRHLPLIESPSARHYLVAEKMRQGGLDWRESLLETWGTAPERAVMALLLADPSLQPADRRREFLSRTRKSAPTFYRVQAALLKDLGLKL